MIDEMLLSSYCFSTLLFITFHSKMSLILNGLAFNRSDRMKSTIKKLVISSASMVLLMATLPRYQSHDIFLYPITQQASVEASSRSSAFLSHVRRLPSIHSIQSIAPDAYGLLEFQDIKSDILYTRSIYQNLSRRDQNTSEIKRWEAYLSAKEETVGLHFIEAVRALPTVGQLKALSESKTQSIAREMTALRRAFNQLPNIAKTDSEVQRWQGYLNLKEKIVVDPTTYFMSEVQSLPKISDFQQMTPNAFQEAKRDIQAVRQVYMNLPKQAKKEQTIIRQEKFLAEKEAASGITFIQTAKDLPSVSAINKMTNDERNRLGYAIQSAWASYSRLVDTAENDQEVIRWVGYLTQKEEALAFADPHIQARITQLKDRWSELKPVHDTIVYAKKPSYTTPYVPGQLSDQTLNEALNTTNFVRFVAGLPDNIQLNKTYSEEAQAASLVNAINNSITHYPKKPSDMNQSLFDLGYKGASSSNLGLGYLTLTHSILSGYMEDGDYSNIHSVGHRLWILSPKLQEVGFGYVNAHTAMKVVEDNMYLHSQAPYDFISWPAETAMPLNIRQSPYQFWDENYPWSVSLNPDRYDNTKTDHIEVRLTRLNDGKSWNFNNDISDGFFHVSTSSVGYLPYTVIFRPNNITFKTGDRFKVEITGAQNTNGVEETIQFETTFFNL